MTVLFFMLNLSAGVILMTFGVRFVQTGMERALGSSLRLWLTRAGRWRFTTAFAGTGLAIVLQSARKKHLSRLRNGISASILSSDLHLENLRGLKELNSQISSIAHPILTRSGLLQETRLIPR